jgi:hypothetical protein
MSDSNAAKPIAKKIKQAQQLEYSQLSQIEQEKGYKFQMKPENKTNSCCVKCNNPIFYVEYYCGYCSLSNTKNNIFCITCIHLGDDLICCNDCQEKNNCSICKNNLRGKTKDLSTCSTCKKIICSYCMTTCDSCNQNIVCSSCIITCDECGNSICSKCIIQCEFKNCDKNVCIYCDEKNHTKSECECMACQSCHSWLNTRTCETCSDYFCQLCIGPHQNTHVRF